MNVTEAETGVVDSHQENGGHVLIKSTVNTWEAQLPRIHLFNPRTPHVVTSPLIKGNLARSPTSWRVQASHNCWDNDRRVRTIGLYLWRLSNEDLITQKEWNQLEVQQRNSFSNLHTRYKFEILDTEGNPQFTRESAIKLIDVGTAVGGRNFALYDEAVRKKCIVDNTMTVRTTISQFQPLPDKPVEPIKVMFGDKPLGEYNALNLMENSNLDKWIRDTTGSIRPVIDFETILSTTVLGEEHRAITLIQATRKMLIFLDTGKCPSLSKTLKKKDTLKMKATLYNLAKIFCIEGLKKVCVKGMIEMNLTISDCLRIVRFMCKMDILNAPEYTPQINELKAFMRKNFEELSQTEDMGTSFKKYYDEYTRLVLEPDL